MSKPQAPMLVLIGVALGVGCGGVSSYAPQEPGRIHFVRNESGRVLEKNGKTYRISPFRGDLREAVAGDPVAEEHARKYVRQTWSSGGMLLLALACLVPAGPLIASDNTGPRAAGMGLAVAGMTAFALALFMPQLARHHLYDAVNVYNDNLADKKPTEWQADEGRARGPSP